MRTLARRKLEEGLVVVLTSGPRLAVAAMAVASLACGSPQKRHDPFRVPRDTITGSVKVIALAPVRLPDDLEDPEPVRARFTALLTDRLRQAGLRVVDAADVAPIVEARTREAGGLFDPATGRVDEARSKALRAAIGRELKERFGADAWIDPQVRVVNAPVSRDWAQWDGVAEAVNQGYWQKFLLTHSGVLPALSFYVWLNDPGGAHLYVNAGGIQVLGRIGLGGGFVRRPRSELFGDEERNANAVRIALDPLVQERR